MAFSCTRAGGYSALRPTAPQFIATPNVPTENNHKFAVCVQNTDYAASLILRKLYQVLPDDTAAAHGYLRLVDESGEDYLYPDTWFSPIELPETLKQSLLTA